MQFEHAARANEEGYGKAGKQKPLSNFPTATANYEMHSVMDTDSKGKVMPMFRIPFGNRQYAPYVGPDSE